MEQQMKLLMSAFISILIGIILLSVIANDVEKVSTNSINVPNETLNFANVVGTITAEQFILSNGTTHNQTGTVANDQLLTFTSLINVTGEILTSFCNMTLSTGTLFCNDTGTGKYSNTTNMSYTYVAGRTETLSNTDILSVTSMQNATSQSIRGYCNVTFVTGAVVCNNTKNNTGYINYNWEPDNVITDGATQTITRLVILFFAIFVFIIGVAFAVAAFKQSGVM